MRQREPDKRRTYQAVTCPSPLLVVRGDFSECAHPGFHHPRGLGEVVETVTYGVPVYDGDGDLVVSARPGSDVQGWQEYGGQVFPILTYIWGNPREWVEMLGDRLPEDARSVFRNKSQIALSGRWATWLIEDEEDEKQILAEVRQRLGLE